MASQSFRDSINSLGWSRRDQDVPANTSQRSGLLSSIKSLNPFGDGGYVRLPTTESAGAPLPAPTRREEEEGWFVCESSCPAATASLGFPCPPPPPPVSVSPAADHAAAENVPPSDAPVLALHMSKRSLHQFVSTF